MNLQELAQWLGEGVSPEQIQFDLPSEQHPEEGMPVVGYHVAYTYTDPDTKETTYVSPLTYTPAPGLIAPESDTFLKSSVPVHNTRESDVGFYYFVDQGMAENYMRMIALDKLQEGSQRQASDLTLLRVSGIADTSSSGLRMKDMHIDDEVFSIPVEDMVALSDRLKHR